MLKYNPAMNLTVKVKENKKVEKVKLERVMPITGHKLDTQASVNHTHYTDI